MLSLSIIDLVFFTGASQGIFLAIALQWMGNKKSAANTILSLLLFMASIMLIGRLFYLRHNAEWVHQWSLLPDVFIFLFGPLSYLFLRKLIFDKSNEHFSFAHFVPALLFMGIFFYYISFPVSEYMMLLRNGRLTLIFYIIESSAIVLNFFYWFKSYQLIRTYRLEEKNALSYSQGPLIFFRFFIVAVQVCLVTWLLSFIDSYYFFGHLPYISYDLTWIAIPISIYVIGYFSLRQPELFRMPASNAASSTNMKLDRSEIEYIENSVQLLVIKEKIYLKKDLTLSDLSKMIDTSTNKLSWYLNNVQGCSFYDYINNLRIKEFLKRLDTGDHIRQTILSLSLEVGFNSKSTFNKAFKVVMNDTPSSYIKTYEMDRLN